MPWKEVTEICGAIIAVFGVISRLVAVVPKVRDIVSKDPWPKHLRRTFDVLAFAAMLALLAIVILLRQGRFSNERPVTASDAISMPITLDFPDKIVQPDPFAASVVVVFDEREERTDPGANQLPDFGFPSDHGPETIKVERGKGGLVVTGESLRGGEQLFVMLESEGDWWVSDTVTIPRLRLDMRRMLKDGQVSLMRRMYALANKSRVAAVQPPGP